MIRTQTFEGQLGVELDGRSEVLAEFFEDHFVSFPSPRTVAVVATLVRSAGATRIYG